MRNHQLNWQFVYYLLLGHIRWWRMDLRRRQPIWLVLVGCLAHRNAQITLWEHQIIMLEIHRAKSLNSGNPQIKCIVHRDIATRVRSHHFQALPSFNTMPHSTWHQAHNQAQEQHKDIQIMGHHGKHIISPKEVMVDLKCSLLSNSQDMGRHLQAHLECLQQCHDWIQSFGQHLPPPLHQDNVLAHLGGPPLDSQRNDSSRLQIRGGLILQGLPICLHCQRILMTNTTLIIRVTICRT